MRDASDGGGANADARVPTRIAGMLCGVDDFMSWLAVGSR
jgi:hypothetical protein